MWSVSFKLGKMCLVIFKLAEDVLDRLYCRKMCLFHFMLSEDVLGHLNVDGRCTWFNFMLLEDVVGQRHVVQRYA